LKLGIGIDTGGTYTDAVIYDFDSRAILGSAKSLTTKNDLTIGILGAIDGLPAHLAQQAALISLSTTLATNACVEGRGGQAKLIFFGGDAKLIDDVGGNYGLPPASDMYIQESFTQFSGEMEREPDWDLFRSQLASGFDHLDGVGIVEMNAIRNGGFVEKKAKAIFQEAFSQEGAGRDIPVVCGHELFSVLNSLQRGSSTLLNARLFPIIKEFLTAVKKALAIRHINAPLVIVRSDGSLMSEAFASVRPVETLLCGPAASAIGGTQLTPNSVIVDMGGTTTDIAFVTDGAPVTVTDGVSIGGWKTFVDGLYVKTFGLGGDSAIHYDGAKIDKLQLEAYRVIPLCVAAQEYPQIIDNLKALELRRHGSFLYEHYMRIKDISDNARYSAEEKAFCEALAAGPLILTDAAAAIGKDIYTLSRSVERLIKDGIVQICGLTPTDIMHIKGDFDRYCTEASQLAAAFAAYNVSLAVEAFCDLAYDVVKRKMYVHIAKALFENKYPDYMKNGVPKDVERFINDNYEAARAGHAGGLLSTTICTSYALVGMGAPIRVFLADVANMLGTSLVISQHHEVANALGAVMGSISASYTVDIRPKNDGGEIVGYTVYGSHENKAFEELEEALAYANDIAKTGAAAEAVRRGAVGELNITVSQHKEEAEARDFAVYLGTKVTASVVGALGFQ